MSMYSTDLNIIAGISDFRLIEDVTKLRALEPKHVRFSDITPNRYGIRTDKAFERFIASIDKCFLKFKNDDHQQLFLSAFKENEKIISTEGVLFFHLAINDRLFSELTINIFIKMYDSGREIILPDNFLEHLIYLRSSQPTVSKWSDSTIQLLASKYLTLLRKLGFLEGKLIKKIRPIYWNDPTLVYFVYLIKAVDIETVNFLKTPYFPLLFMDKDTFVKRIKDIAKTGIFGITSLGYDLRFDMKYSYKEIVNAINQHYRSKI